MHTQASKTASTLSKEAILEIIDRAVRELFNKPLPAITRETRLEDGLGIDSLEIVELMMKLEEELEISIPEELPEDTTIAALVNAIDTQLRALSN